MGINIKNAVVLLLAVFWSSFLIYQSCTPSSDTGSNAESVTSSFVGNNACKSCHQSEFNQWSDSHHANAMSHASDSTVLGDFSQVTFESNGILTTFITKEEAYYALVEDEEGITEYKITYTFGWEPLQQYLVEFPDGRLQAFHIAWDTEKNSWFEINTNANLDKNDWMHWTNGSMTWNKMCAECHSTNLEKNYLQESESYKTTWSEINVSCESCHGPGETHVLKAETGEFQSGKPKYLTQLVSDPSIVQVESCAPCHSRRSSLGSTDMYEGRFLDHYTPDILRTNIYFPDGQILEEDYVYGSFVQSKMFQNGVKCTDCHNPHTAELKREGNLLCTSCHTEKYNSAKHTFHPAGTESGQCISCHMTGRTYMGNDFRRDHSFRIPRPDQSVSYNTPNACTGCHTDKTDAWAKDAIINWYGPEREFHFSDVLVKGFDHNSANELITLINSLEVPGIARATAVDYLAIIPTEQAYQSVLLALNDRDALVRTTALQSLIQLPKEDRIQFSSPLLGDPVRSVRVTSALILADVDTTELPIRYHEEFKKASFELKAKLDINRDFSSGQLQLAQVHDRRGEIDLAIESYQKALKMDSLLPGVRINLARLYSINANSLKAIQVLEQELKIFPDNANAMYSLGLVLAEEERSDDALVYFSQAAQLQPQNMRIPYNWGLVLNQLGRGQEAILILENALNYDSQADDIRYALVTIYISEGDNLNALKQATILSQKYPQNAEIAGMVRQLKAKAN